MLLKQTVRVWSILLGTESIYDQSNIKSNWLYHESISKYLWYKKKIKDRIMSLFGKKIDCEKG